jgi:hypothetical protein
MARANRKAASRHMRTFVSLARSFSPAWESFNAHNRERSTSAYDAPDGMKLPIEQLSSSVF